MAKILSMRQFEVWYGLGRPTIRRMLLSGDLEGIKTTAGWRIVDPSPLLFQRLVDRATGIERACFLQAVEVAALLGMSSRRLRRLAEEGKIHFEWHGKRRLYPLAEVRRLLSEREQGRKRGSGSYVRLQVISWAKKRLALRQFASMTEGVPLFEAASAGVDVPTDSGDASLASNTGDQDSIDELKSASGKTFEELSRLREEWLTENL